MSEGAGVGLVLVFGDDARGDEKDEGEAGDEVRRRVRAAPTVLRPLPAPSLLVASPLRVARSAWLCFADVACAFACRLEPSRIRFGSDSRLSRSICLRTVVEGRWGWDRSLLSTDRSVNGYVVSVAFCGVACRVVATEMIPHSQVSTSSCRRHRAPPAGVCVCVCARVRVRVQQGCGGRVICCRRGPGAPRLLRRRVITSGKRIGLVGRAFVS